MTAVMMAVMTVVVAAVATAVVTAVAQPSRSYIGGLPHPPNPSGTIPGGGKLPEKLQTEI
jgi:hypothetical protein